MSSAAITIPVTDTPQYALIQVAISAAISRGTVTTASTDLSKSLTIDPQRSSDASDQQVTVATVKRARETQIHASLYFVGTRFQSSKHNLVWSDSEGTRVAREAKYAIPRAQSQARNYAQDSTDDRPRNKYACDFTQRRDIPP